MSTRTLRIDRPVDLWSMAREQPASQLALLDNPGRPSRLGRMSYLGLFPQQELRVGADEDPAQALTQLARFTRPRATTCDAAAPFSSGVIGYLAYELLHGIEPSVACPGGQPAEGSLIHLVRYAAVVAVDSAAGTTEVCAASRGDLAAARALVEAAPPRSEIPPPPRPDGPFGTDQLRACGFEPLTTPAEYRARVEDARRQIAAGRFFEVCLSQQFHATAPAAGTELYDALRRRNPVPMGAYLRDGDLEILCTSPERLVAVSAAGEIETRPIKGTRARAADAIADRHLAEALVASPKDRAENTMIVDLARNDLGRICLTGSVEVPELCIVESYAGVHHLVSTVRGQLAAGAQPADVIRACFPGGSMTGAPKVEAMKAIAEVERAPRGIFSGAIGWIGDDGAIDLNIVIRTLIKQGDRVTLRTGGAVTSDSDPQAEYAETLDKARAPAEALATARAVSRVS